jgi:zinc transport system ATP-binding protein
MSEIAVRFDSVSFSYGDIHVLENASFHIHKGEFTAMVGPNGSGKTTVLKLLFGLETPSAGTIEIFAEGKKSRGRSNSSLINMAYVSQNMQADNLFPITVRDIVRMGLLHPYNRYIGRQKEKEAVTQALEKTGIFDLASRLYRSLSGGQKRRVLVARALAGNPDLLVLDEPTANMDVESETQLYKTLGAYKGKVTIIVVTHDTEFVTSLTDRVLCLGAGRKVVQHRTESYAGAGMEHHGGVGQEVRVLHEENITSDECCLTT